MDINGITKNSFNSEKDVSKICTTSPTSTCSTSSSSIISSTPVKDIRNPLVNSNDPIEISSADKVIL